ncbi:MAG TPA: hypothetical protein VNO30_07810 [Kofleriaceae bacterium]|nr:hypothetical protein [Kofleriaceae bacterium]
MSDDERKRRRLGDETKARIADLASGWDIPSASSGAPDAGAKPGAPASAPRRAQPKTQPPPPSAAARRGLDDVLLDMSDDLDSLLEPDESGVSAGAAGAAKRGGDARRPSSARREPTEDSVDEDSVVDVSGLIADQTPPPEPIVPAPTVDASALGGTVLTSEPAAPSAAASAVKGSPLAGAKGPGRAVPPPTRSGARTNPPPPPVGGRATSMDATIPASAGAPARTGASGSLPASAAASASAGATARTRASGSLPASPATSAGAGATVRTGASGSLPASAAAGAGAGATARTGASGSLPASPAAAAAAGATARTGASGSLPASAAASAGAGATARTGASGSLPASPAAAGAAAGATARTGASGSLPASAAASAGPRKAAAPSSSADADTSDSGPIFAGLTSGATAAARTPVSSADADTSDSGLIFDDLAIASAAPTKQRGLTAAIAEVEEEDDDDSEPSFDDLASSPPARGAGSSSAGRLPLPAAPGEPAARPRTVPAPHGGSPRPGRAVHYGDDSGTETAPEATPPRTRPGPPLAVPVGEFDASRAQPTIQRAELAERAAPKSPRPPAREASSGVLLVEAGGESDRDDATTIDPKAQRPGRGDPMSGVDPTGILVSGASGARAPKARLRTVAQLHRTRGVGGDLRYVLTVIFGLRRARREIGALEAQEATLQQSRRRHLTTLGRTAVSSEGFDHPALSRARAQLADIEDDRARNLAAVAAADDELQRVNKDREATARQHATQIEEIDAEIAELQKQLQPLEKELAGVTRRAAALRDSVRRLDEKIALTEARLAGADLQEAERGAIQAEIASLKADRKALQKDEPELASALDSLQPQIAKLEAARADARRRRTDVEQADRDDLRWTQDLLAAVGAKRKVLDRTASDAETRRDKIALELGDRIYVTRPERMGPELAPLDAIDVELGTVNRRTMELREILQSVDRWKLVRSIGLWLLLFAVIGFGVYGAMLLGLI